MLSQLCGLRSRIIRVRVARGRLKGKNAEPQPPPPAPPPSTGLAPLLPLLAPTPLIATVCKVTDRDIRPPPTPPLPPPAQLTGLVVTDADNLLARRSIKAAAEESAPRSTEPPISAVEPAANRAACCRSGWLAIRSTSSRSSVDERPELTKAVSKTWWCGERWWRRERLQRRLSESDGGGGGDDDGGGGGGDW